MTELNTVKRIGVTMAIIGVAVMAWGVLGMSQQEGESAASGLTEGLRALGAGLAFLGGAIGTGIAQSRAVAAVVGSVAEDPGQLGTGILLIVIPETLVILGFVVLFIL